MVTARQIVGSFVAIMLSIVWSHAAGAVTLVSSWPIGGDVVPVTMTFTDLPSGNGVEITVAIPEGMGDILGLFGNVTNESLVSHLDAVGALVYQKQFAANLVYKVGGGNEVAPVQQWDWGLLFGSSTWQSEDIHTATFQLTAPGLTSVHLLNAANQGWYFGVRIRHTLGPKMKASIGFPVSPPPAGNAPTIAITTPAEAAVFAQSDVPVAGTLTGTTPIAVTVNGIWAYLSSGSVGFQRTLTLADGTHTIRALAGNSWGHTGDEVTVTVDTVAPVISIAAPAVGTLTTGDSIVVSGTAADTTSGVASVVVNGVSATLVGSAFNALVPLALGASSITATATDVAGNTAAASTSVTRGIAPAVAITAPATGLLTNQTPVAVTGTVSGNAPVSVIIGGVAATVTGETWISSVALAEGSNTLTVSAVNAFGSGSSSVAVTLDTTPPIVTIATPVEGAQTAAASIVVEGTVEDASPIASLLVNGQSVPVVAGTFTTSLSLSVGTNSIAAVATDTAGNSGSDSSMVERGVSPTISIASPGQGFATAESETVVTGVVTGTEPLAVLVNGSTASVGAGAFSATVPLLVGANTIAASVSNAFGSASAEISGTRTETGLPLSITIQSPPDGAVVSARVISVSGAVSDGTAQVTVNGTAAIVTGTQYIAPIVELVEGESTLVAVATRGSDTAQAQTTIAYNSPPQVVITSPAEGDALRVALTDVVGVVDDLAAYVDVNGVVASVGSGGRFTASDVPLALGENPLRARAIDLFGAMGTDEVRVIRDDASLPRLRLVFMSPERYPFLVGPDTEPLPLIAEDAAEFRAALGGLGFPGDEFVPPIDRIQHSYGDHVVFAFAEEPGDIAFFENDVLLEGPFPLLPIADLPNDFIFQFGDLDPDVIPELLPIDFHARYFTTFTRSVPIDGGAIEGEFTLRAEASSGGVDELLTATDVGLPIVEILSPADGSTVAPGAITVTGTAAYDGNLFQRVRYDVYDEENFLLLTTGTVPLIAGRFSIPGVALGTGRHCVFVTASDAAGNNEGDDTCFTVDPDAPTVQLASPRDGEAVLASSVSVDLNFAAPTTLVSVNGAADGRSLPAGVANDLLALALAVGPNVVTLVVDSGTGPVTFAFTIFRVESVEPIRIVEPRDNALRNLSSVPVTVRAPLGTTAVSINGVLATRAADGVSHVADVVIGSGDNSVVSIAYPFGQIATSNIVGDFKAPRFLAAIPSDGSVTADAETILAGYFDEDALIAVEGPAGSVSTSTRFDQALSNRRFGFEIYRFDVGPLSLVAGTNEITVRARDAAGNESTHVLSIERQAGALVLASPADGASTPGFRTNVVLQALADLTIEAWYSGAARVPAFTGVQLSPGTNTFSGVPLQPGQNDMRVVYRGAGGAAGVLTFGIVSTAENFATITGTVIDSRTGSGLGGALVTITVNGVTVVVATAPDGSYNARVEPGDTAILVSREGFLDETFAATVIAGETRVVDAAPLPWTTASQPIPGAPPGTSTSVVAGLVRDRQAGDPIAGASIEVLVDAIPFSTTSGADGSYRVDGLPSGQFSMTVSRVGYTTRIFEVPLTTTVLLAIDVVLETGGAGGNTTTTVAGTVTDRDGQPLAAAEITASVGGTPISTSSGADGRYRLDGIPPGAFSVVISRAGYFPQIYEIPYATAVLVPLNPVLARIATTTTVVGIVRSRITGLVEQNVLVELLGSEFTATTDASGRFTIEQVPIGTEQTLQLAKPGFLEEFATFTAPTLPEGYPLELELSYPRLESSDATLAIGPDASGTVVDSLTGKALPGALVEAGSITAIADGDGRFTLHGLTLRTPVEVIASAADHEVQKVVALVVAGGGDPLDFSLGALRLGEIQGVVTDAASGQPIREAEVRVEGSETLVAATKSDGSYRLLSVPVGTHDVTVISPEHFPASIGGVAVPEAPSTIASVSLDARPRVGGLEGRVVDETTGLPIAGALLTPEAGVPATTSAADGRYAFEGLRAGLNRVTIAASGYAASVRAAPVSADVDSATPTVTSFDFKLSSPMTDASAVSAVIVASEGGFLETPDGRARLDIPPGSLTGDGEITVRITSQPEAVAGDALSTDPELNLPPVTALADEIEILVGAPPGGEKPFLVGPTFFSARFYESASVTSSAAERSAFPYFFDGSQWTALAMVPYFHAVDRINNVVVVGLLFGETETGRDVIARPTTKRPIQLAQLGGGLPGGGLIVDSFRLIVGAVAANAVINENVEVVDLLGNSDFNTTQADPPFYAINTYSRPILVAHGWSPQAILVDSQTFGPSASARYSTMLRDLINSTNAIYRPIWLTYNSRASLAANGQAFAEKIQAMYADGTEEDPLFGDAFEFPINTFQNPKIFGTFDAFGFSMGGLLGRSYQRASFYYDSAPSLPGDEERRGRFNRMVSMGTPHHGALQALRGYATGVGIAFGAPIELVLSIWSPGTNQLFDYLDDDGVACPVSGNSFLCGLNRDPRSGPNKEISAIAGTKSIVGLGPVLLDLGISVVPSAISDGVVPLSSGHGESTLSRRLVRALHGRKKFQQTFDHHNAGQDATSSGEGDQRIQRFVDTDILPTLQDHWVVRRRTLDEQAIPVLVECPTVEAEGRIRADIAFDFKAENGGLTGIGLVTYAEDPEGEWHIIHGTDPSSLELNSNTLLATQGNSRNKPDPDENLVISFDEEIDAGIDAQRFVVLIATTGALSSTEGKAQEELTEAQIEILEDEGRIKPCLN